MRHQGEKIMPNNSTIEQAWKRLQEIGLNVDILKQLDLDDSYVVELSRSLQKLPATRPKNGVTV